MLVSLPAFRHGGANCHYDFHLIGIVAEGRFQRLLQLLRHRVFEPVHEFQLILQRNVQGHQAVGEVEHDLEKFQVDAPLILAFELQRLFRGIALHHRDGFTRHGEHQFSQLAKAVFIFSRRGSHRFPEE